MRIGGQDRQLPALPRPGIDAHVGEGDRQQPGRHLLAGGHHRVVFPGIVGLRGLAAPAHQFVGLARHRRYDHGDIVTGVDFALDVVRDVADALEVRDGRAAEFHHESSHGIVPATTSAGCGFRKLPLRKPRIHSREV